MNFFYFFLISALPFMSWAHGDSEIINKALQIELIEMTTAEQHLRNQWIHASDSTTEEILREQVIQIDNLHLVRLKEVVIQYGWPGFSIAGQEGSHAFWLLVQHTPDLFFQSQCLDLLEVAVLKQEASPIDLAYLKDRVCINAGKKQIYGTQLKEDLTLYPIEEEEHVNERRIAIGLPSIEDYLESIKEFYKNSCVPSQ